MAMALMNTTVTSVLVRERERDGQRETDRERQTGRDTDRQADMQTDHIICTLMIMSMSRVWWIMEIPK